MTSNRAPSITAEDINSLAVAFAYDTRAPINSVDIRADGLIVATSFANGIHFHRISDDLPALHIVTTGSYGGSDIVQFLPKDPEHILHSSLEEGKFIIRKLNFGKRSYNLFFSGHSKRVTSIAPSPTSSVFVSASEDCSIRLWDDRTQKYMHMIKTPDVPFVAIHPAGMTIAAAIGSSTIKIIDMRYLDKSVNEFHYEKEAEWTGAKMSANGSTLLVSSGSSLRTFDLEKGEERGKFIGFKNAQNQTIEASFTSPSKFIATGSSTGLVHVWNSSTGEKIGALRGYSNCDTVQCVTFSQMYMMMVTAANSSLKFWIENK